LAPCQTSANHQHRNTHQGFSHHVFQVLFRHKIRRAPFATIQDCAMKSPNAKPEYRGASNRRAAADCAHKKSPACGRGLLTIDCDLLIPKRNVGASPMRQWFRFSQHGSAWTASSTRLSP
jgi:hypothetical protein